MYKETPLLNFSDLARLLTGLQDGPDFVYGRKGTEVLKMYHCLPLEKAASFVSYFGNKGLSDLVYELPDNNRALPLSVIRQMWLFMVTELDVADVDIVLTSRNMEHGIVEKKAEHTSTGEPELYLATQRTAPTSRYEAVKYLAKSWLACIDPVTSQVTEVTDQGEYQEYPDVFRLKGRYYGVGSTAGEALGRARRGFRNSLEDPSYALELPTGPEDLEVSTKFRDQASDLLLDILYELPEAHQTRALSILFDLEAVS